MRRGRRRLRAFASTGCALAVLYVLAVFATGALRPGLARPLYDGFVPPSSYQWVKPPGFFAAGNVKPEPASATIMLTSRGSTAAGVATPDGQFVINVGAGAIAPRAGATNVAVDITPLAPSSLPALPDGLRGNGNVYRVEMRYEPGQFAVTDLTRPGNLLVEVPELGTQLYRTTDRATWTAVPAHPIGPRRLTLVADFNGPGDYVAATSLPELVTAAQRSSHAALIVAVVVGLVAIMLLAAVVIGTRRRRPASPKPTA